MDDDTININLMIIGDSNVGKSNICSRFTSDLFSETINPTIAADLFSKEIKIENKIVQLKIWDTAG